MNWMDGQTPIDISGAKFPKIDNKTESPPQRFWFVKDEFIKHSQRMLNEGQMFSRISARLIGNRWECAGPRKISISDIACFVWSLRLFYMKSECMSVFSICTYLENNIDNPQVKRFYRHMKDSWEEYLERDVSLTAEGYKGPIKKNKHLIDTLLYSGNFHSQEKYKKRFDELLEYMDESLIFMKTYNALHSGYQMNQISRSLSQIRPENMVILLPNHLSHEWDENCPYKVIR